MSRLYMRTGAEAHLYMDQQPCACGDVEFDRQSAVMSDGGLLCSRYFGKCRTCGTMREFIFELPPTQLPVTNQVEFGGRDASRLLDAGEWLAIAERHAKLEPGTRDDLDIARAAIEEVIKFLPDGVEDVPETAFWTERGRAVRDREPRRFRAARLAAIRDAYRKQLAQRIGPRPEGAVRLAATSERGETVESLALHGNEVVAGGSRRLDLATLQERPSKPLVPPAHAKFVLDEGERLLVLQPEESAAISAVASERGDEVRFHDLRAGKRRGLAIGQRTMLAASVSPNGKAVILLDEEGGVLCYDLSTHAYPASARARKPERGKRASVDLAWGGRLWLAAAGAFLEVRMMSDEKALATVDLSPLGDEVTSAIFLPDASGFLAGTARGAVMRFELLLDRVGSSRDARIAAIADAVDADIAGTRWRRYAPRVEVYDERTESGRTTLYFVADHYEYHHAQSGSDWAEHHLCSGHATFEGERRVEAQVASSKGIRITEREAESYDPSAALAELRAAAARERSSATVVPGADAIKRAFDAYFAGNQGRMALTLPEKALHHTTGEFSYAGWDVRYRFGEEEGIVYLDVFAENRMTNDRLYRVYADGRVDLVGASTEGMDESEDRVFYAEVKRRFS